MKPRSHLTKLQWRSLIGLTLLLLGLLMPSLALALPPRTTPPAEKAKKDKPVGAYIELQAATVPGDGWVVVQWQDSDGAWHDVEGWRGPLPGNTRWWVAAKDFGARPFRWVVTQGPGGAVLKTSPAFNLPDEANETVQVSLTLP